MLDIGRFALIFEDTVMSLTYKSLVLLCFIRNKHLQGKKIQSAKDILGTSPVIQWLEIHLPVVETQIQSLVQEDSKRHGQLSL